MHDVRANMIENRLYIAFKGKVEMEEYKQAAEQIHKTARRLVSGFVTITDIREMAPAAEEVRLQIQDTMKYLKGAGLAMEFRLTSPQGQVTANQFQRTSRSIGYLAQEVHSLTEVERMLDQM